MFCLFVCLFVCLFIFVNTYLCTTQSFVKIMKFLINPNFAHRQIEGPDSRRRAAEAGFIRTILELAEAREPVQVQKKRPPFFVIRQVHRPVYTDLCTRTSVHQPLYTDLYISICILTFTSVKLLLYKLYRQLAWKCLIIF